METLEHSLLHRFEQDTDGRELERVRSAFKEDLSAIAQDMSGGIEPARYRRAEALKDGIAAADRVAEHVWSKLHR